MWIPDFQKLDKWEDTVKFAVSVQVECKKIFSISILHAHCNNKLILYIIIKEKGESYNLYVDKC
jgi:hypothetical protein